MKLKEKCKYALVVPTSMGVRLTPENGQPFHCSRNFVMQATSAETNVASVASYLGLSVKVLTAFVKDSPVARFIKDDLRSRGMDYEGPDKLQDGPWGYRHQFNLADSGCASRGPRVQNDRAGEVGITLSVDDFDLKRIFVEEGVEMLHLSGLIAALSSETAQFCLKLAQYAKSNGTRISFDLNHRASFWINREDELGEVFREIASVSDVLIGNEEDFQLCLGLKGPEAGGKDITEKINAFKEMIETAKREFPGTEVFATTLREVENANSHLWGAILSAGDEWHIVKPRRIGVMDRIGGGDGFVGGMLYAILRGWSSDKWVQFGWASGAFTVTLLTDYAQPADEDQIWSVWEGNARVKR